MGFVGGRRRIIADAPPADRPALGTTKDATMTIMLGQPTAIFLSPLAKLKLLGDDWLRPGE